MHFCTSSSFLRHPYVRTQCTMSSIEYPIARTSQITTVVCGSWKIFIVCWASNASSAARSEPSTSAAPKTDAGFAVEEAAEYTGDTNGTEGVTEAAGLAQANNDESSDSALGAPASILIIIAGAEARAGAGAGADAEVEPPLNTELLLGALDTLGTLVALNKAALAVGSAETDPDTNGP